ncbi:MAG TPA: 23S rRNA (pseudouridine(1915)-N(3))-methyltransferase RlmH, partial [Steroidobacteraceae bacterium]|nr:23S rRNA (pseudouridine(1915)-N(3))-methyltransferase RlmH [Steroidobacteraceae bacterium]
AGRMPRVLPLELIEVRSEPRGEGKSVTQLLAAEAGRIERAVPDGCLRVALDERGRELTTAALARWLEEQRRNAASVAFLIGGADGLAAEVKDKASMRLRLSALTLPHGLARLLLAEQLYRASSILQGHPYHRA